MYQIWLLPDEQNAEPTYQENLNVEGDMPRNAFKLMVSPDGGGNTMRIRQDARLSIGHFDAGSKIGQDLDKDRKYWIQIAHGHVTLNGVPLTTADGMGLSGESLLTLSADSDAHILFFDMAA